MVWTEEATRAVLGRTVSEPRGKTEQVALFGSPYPITAIFTKMIAATT
jgi:hypothetical protein